MLGISSLLLTLVLAWSMSLQAVFEKRLKDTAMAVPLMCCAADMHSVSSHRQVVLVGCKPSAEFDSMLAAAHASYDPNRIVEYLHTLPTSLSFYSYHQTRLLEVRSNWVQVIHIDPSDDEERGFWEETNGNIAAMARSNFAADKVVALVCQNFTCSPPVGNPKTLESLLSKWRKNHDVERQVAGVNEYVSLLLVSVVLWCRLAFKSVCIHLYFT